MLFENAQDFVDAPRHAITVFGMAGVGKTHLSALLRKNRWFHYSVDYRIGTRHMGEFIVDNFKREAMRVPFLRDLLISDSIYISSNITFANLDPLSTYLGTPGNPEQGGLPIEEYSRRQEQHRVAEIHALHDIPYFVEKSQSVYGYKDFIVDSGGSLIEVIDVDNKDDEVIKTLADNTALLYIRGNDDDAQKLIDRFCAAPKPMYYRPEFLTSKWAEYKHLNDIDADDEVDPTGFASWGFEALLHDRLPRYQALADRHGYTIDATDISTMRDGKDFLDIMRKAITARKGM